MGDDAAASEKMSEKERKKQEIRARLEAQIQSTKKKKGFMTPERKKRLRQLLRKKAADELKRQQEFKELERRRIITERTGNPKPLDDANEASLMAICKEYHNRILGLNEDKWDLELYTTKKEYEINELASKVNDLRGKFVIPPLKKVSKAAQQLEKIKLMNAKLAKLDMKGSLKQVKREITLDSKETKKSDIPQWFKEKGNPQEKKQIVVESAENDDEED